MTYDYICKDCKHEWQEEQSIKDDAIKLCPNCGKETAKRLISSPGGFILIGSWAKEGYK